MISLVAKAIFSPMLHTTISMSFFRNISAEIIPANLQLTSLFVIDQPHGSDQKSAINRQRHQQHRSFTACDKDELFENSGDLRSFRLNPSIFIRIASASHVLSPSLAPAALSHPSSFHCISSANLSPCPPPHRLPSSIHSPQTLHPQQFRPRYPELGC